MTERPPMKTAEQMRETAAQVAENLERRWRASAKKSQEDADSVWLGGAEDRKKARILTAAADGLAAVVKVIRKLPLE